MRRTVAMNTECAEARLPHADRTHVHASTTRGDNMTSNSVTNGVILRIHTFCPHATRGTCGTARPASPVPYSYRNALIGSSCDARRAG